MKTKMICVASLATLGLLATGCQKENKEFMTFPTSSSISEYAMEYSVDGEHHVFSTWSEKEYDAMLTQLIILAREGYEVTINNSATFQQTGLSKDVVIFTSQDEKKVVNWTKKMMDDGYKVSVSYDSSTNTFTCVAIK
jgi:hypothetical protein